MSFKPISVSQLSTYIKQIFDAEELLHGICVVGEISGWSNVRGTAYFTLKDASSALSCVCFTADKYSDFKNGDSVMVVGSVTYYTKSGKLNFNVSKIEAYGESVLYKQFLELKSNLEQKGYFDVSHKAPMPKKIKRIGVVSSEGGAVIQDIINIRTRRNKAMDIVLYPVKVQGVGAEYEIAKGIYALDNYNVDVIVVARGGGSFEDLQPFNTEVVADATYNCNKFIMSAVGHETDYTIIDFCSDMRAPTPSAAAELLCEDVQEQKRNVYLTTKNLLAFMTRFLDFKTESFKDNLIALYNNYNYIEQNCKLEFYRILKEFNKTSKIFIEKQEARLLNCSAVLKKLDPSQVLKLGYACLKLGKSYINSVKELKTGDNVEIGLKDGTIKANITQIQEGL